jgi:hypothetical protein
MNAAYSIFKHLHYLYTNMVSKEISTALQDRTLRVIAEIESYIKI